MSNARTAAVPTDAAKPSDPTIPPTYHLYSTNILNYKWELTTVSHSKDKSSPPLYTIDPGTLADDPYIWSDAAGRRVGSLLIRKPKEQRIACATNSRSFDVEVPLEGEAGCTFTSVDNQALSWHLSIDNTTLEDSQGHHLARITEPDAAIKKIARIEMLRHLEAELELEIVITAVAMMMLKKTKQGPKGSAAGGAAAVGGSGGC